jgi:hypothetical protein
VAGQYEIYDIGNNSILAAYLLGQVGTDWAFVTLGGFYATETSDMLLRNSATGEFKVYDISNNNITGAAFLGTVGMDWQAMGFGNFSSLSETDMLLRNVNTGGLEVYNIRNNQITNVAFMGTVGLNWQFSGVGNFSSRGTSDLLLRNSNTGGLQATISITIRSPARPSWARSAWSGSSRASATSAASPRKAIFCCATPIPVNCGFTTSATTRSPARSPWARSAWIGNSRALLPSAPPAQRQHRHIPSLQHRRQSPDRVRPVGPRRLGLAGRRLRPDVLDRPALPARDDGRLNLSARVGDGGVWRWQRCR